jgi:4-alpha-glucanotransferase
MGTTRKTATRKTKKPDTPLDRLAAYLGIESAYTDARGKLQRTSAETKRGLLQAMGISAEGEAQINSALHEIERADWKRMLQPVYVARADGEPIKIDLKLRSGISQLTWRLRLEDGSERFGQADTDGLALLEQREIDGENVDRRDLPIGSGIPCGYHLFEIDPGAAKAMVIVAPERCWLPTSAEEGRKIWGVAAQLYVLRSKQNWGIGDFGDLRRLTEDWMAAGADVVGLNPLHALFPDAPEHASPYSPASRLLLNVLYIDVDEVPGMEDCKEAQRLIQSKEFQDRLRLCRSASLVDYSEVTSLKMQALQILFKHWTSLSDSAKSAFTTFRRDRGEILERSCGFHCLRQMFVRRDMELSDWHKWPEEYRDPDSATVRRFAEEHAEEITFGSWMQWVADAQLAAAATSADTMEIGLYRDMAVGCDMSGVETWSNQKAVVSGAHIGAPPDIFNPAGQDWGLPPFHPRALKEERYESFVELIRANMRHAGALRIDHIMALQHLYWIPASRSPQNGAYVRYPMEDLIGILALESQRSHCMIVGEDLGTVPKGFRERMAAANILSYRVLFFEQKMKTGIFRRPDEYPRLAVAVASNHDLPTVRAWWLGGDVDLRERLRMYPDPSEGNLQRQLRERDRKQLRRALEKQGLVAKNAELALEELVLLIHMYLARSNSFAALVQLDDLTGEIDPVNLPGSTVEYPNWRRKLSVTIEELTENPRIKEIVKLFAEERGSARRVFKNAAN